LLLCLEYSLEEIYANFVENESLLVKSMSWENLRQDCALISPDVIKEVVARCLVRKGFSIDCTIDELHRATGRHISIIAFCVETHKLVNFCPRVHGNKKIVDVIAASVAIPMLVRQVEVQFTGQHFCDAGLVNSTPVGFCEPQETLALYVRHTGDAPSSLFPETLFARCTFMSNMALTKARAEGMATMAVPFPRGVGLLSRNNITLSAFIDTSGLFTVLFVVRAELLAALAMMLSCLSFCGPKLNPGPPC
jgi:predicted acylesterase/phospholipase RssA